MASLAEEISLLTNPAPLSRDPEDIDDVTRAQVPLSTVDDDLEDGVTNKSTTIRRRASALLADEDSRYAGKKVSRKKLVEMGSLSNLITDNPETKPELKESQDEDDEDVSGTEDDEDSIDSDDDLNQFKAQLKVKSKYTKSSKSEQFSLGDNVDYTNFAHDSDEDVESNDSEVSDEYSDDDNDDDDDDDDGSDENDGDGADSDGHKDDEVEEEDGGISKFSKTKVDEDVKKGMATKTQLNLWDRLLKVRIELQKVLLLINQLPQPDMWHLFKHSGGSAYNAALVEGQAAVKSLLDKMLYLQVRLGLLHPDTKNFYIDNDKNTTMAKKKPAESDEEIPSDSDEEMEDTVDAKAVICAKRKYPLGDYPELLSKRHKAFTTYRNDTIQKWFDKTRVATGKLSKGFSAFEQSALKQIKQILSDRHRLVKRTQLKRSQYHIVGKTEDCDVKNKAEEVDHDNDILKAEPRDRLKEYDEEIFDDDDFYHQLLRELIERKSMDTNDPIALSRQWLELQKLRSKVKRKVDTRASKGRKIRYDILPKLVNFMAPNDTSVWTDEARDELYSSLFGKRNPECQVEAL